MLTVMVTLDVHENTVDDFLEGIRANARATLENEEGCIRFDVHRSSEVPHRFHLYEIYLDREAFETDHRNAPHYATWREVVNRCVVPGSQVNVYAHPEFPDDLPEARAR